MFIKNFSSIPSKAIILVDLETKRYLESLGFCVLSYHNEKFAFTKSDELLNKLLLRKGGNDE